MKKLFRLDSPVVQFMTKVSILILLSIYWAVCSLPVITVGASTAALYRAMFDLREDQGNATKTFFKAFASNFKLGTLCWLVLTACVIVVYCALQVLAMTGLQLVVMAGIALACALYLMLWLMLACVFPLVAYFDNSLKKTLRNAMVIAVKHRKQAFLAAILAAVPLLLFVIEPNVFFYTCGVWLLIYPGVAAHITAGRFAPFFAEYANKRLEKEEVTEDETI